VILKHRGLSPRGTGPAPMRPLAQSGLVDEDDGSSFSLGVFLTSGHSTFFQWAIAFSSRSFARPVGRWQLQPSCLRIRHTWPGWYSTSNSCPISSATRAVVQRPLAYPSASGPLSRPRSSLPSSFSVSLGFRPARPAFFSPRRPLASSSTAQRLTDCRCTPTCRATSACGIPCRSRRAASIRRPSNASKSLFTPAGFPMHRHIPQRPKNVTILCEAQ